MSLNKYLLYILGISLCFINYVQYGITTVIYKYLQNMNVQPLSLTALSNLIVIIVYSPRIIHLFYKHRFETIKKIYNDNIATWLLILLTISILIRCTLFLYGAQLTKSVYFQIINLTSPFFTLIISQILLKILNHLKIDKFNNIFGNRTNFVMIILIILTILSGFVTIVSMQDKDKSSFKWTVDVYSIFSNFGTRDALGLSLLLISMVFITFYNICIKLLTNKEKETDIESNLELEETKKQLISNEFIFIHHIIIYSVFYSVLGILFEDWSYLLSKNWLMYVLIIVYGLTAYFLGNVVYFLAISYSSTTVFALFTSVSLISNIAFAEIFIPEEKITNLWTIIGSVSIVICVTLFAIIKLKYQ